MIEVAREKSDNFKNDIKSLLSIFIKNSTKSGKAMNTASFFAVS
ncbi:hypothetical protein D028_1467 [Vibrio parahaemolyticus 50]|nr:hypothetical protein D028_1467 [Vibrio parahaemolyticus 50]